jgi:hypothetical protein
MTAQEAEAFLDGEFQKYLPLSVSERSTRLLNGADAAAVEVSTLDHQGSFNRLFVMKGETPADDLMRYAAVIEQSVTRFGAGR